jgi:hypothetical protein
MRIRTRPRAVAEVACCGSIVLRQHNSLALQASAARMDFKFVCLRSVSMIDKVDALNDEVFKTRAKESHRMPCLIYKSQRVMDSRGNKLDVPIACDPSPFSRYRPLYDRRSALRVTAGAAALSADRRRRCAAGAGTFGVSVAPPLCARAVQSAWAGCREARP